MGTDPIILFRTDGNSKIAAGHVVRCLSVANACGAFCSHRLFLVSDSESLELVQQFLSPDTMEIQVLTSADYRNPEQELPELIGILKACALSANTKPILFVDSYFVTEAYFEKLAPYARLIYLDDLQLFDYKVDMVINYDVLSTQTLAEYEAKYTFAGKRLLGEAYTPLRPQFTGCSSPAVREGNSAYPIMITSGGTDSYHTCLRLSQELLNHSALFTEKIVLHIVVGMMNTDRKELHALAQSDTRVILHENVTDMAALMSSCQLAYSAAGTTLYELCAMGIPTASFVIADNQLACAKAFSQSGTVKFLGDVRTDEAQVYAGALAFLVQMLSDPLLYKKTATQMQQLIDGQGSSRIAKAIASEFF